jgi:8-oxo-dGTP pyrophosphatase MutT (NUDIX family)
MTNVKGSYGRFACIRDVEEKILLVQRGFYFKGEDKMWDGRWNLPGGGVDEEDAELSRTAEEILAREVKEETGLEVVIADYRPIGEYATAKHTDVAITYLCQNVGGKLATTKEGVDFLFVSPREAVDLAEMGDGPNGLVGGLITSTGGVPRHIQMILHFFTRACGNSRFKEEAVRLCTHKLYIPV